MKAIQKEIARHKEQIKEITPIGMIDYVRAGKIAIHKESIIHLEQLEKELAAEKVAMLESIQQHIFYATYGASNSGIKGRAIDFIDKLKTELTNPNQDADRK